MSTKTKGDCCICGKETTKRCGACQSAGVDLFFCSREHQKLVWKTHGKVCGANSNPFRQPDFSTEELELAKRHMHDNMYRDVPPSTVSYAETVLSRGGTRQGLTETSIASFFAKKLLMPQDRVAPFALAILKDSASLLPLTEEDRGTALAFSRMILYWVATGGQTLPSHLRTLDPFIHLATLQPFLPAEPVLSSQARTELQHQAVMCFALLQIAHSEPAHPTYDKLTLDAFCLHALEHFLDTLTVSLSYTDWVEHVLVVTNITQGLTAGMPIKLVVDPVPSKAGHLWSATVSIDEVRVNNEAWRQA
ncbi:hypothetical protein JCM10207_003922 [Rhodosporidiobolus poonsookiae]